MSRPKAGGRRESPEYEIRPYEPGDSEAFRSLFERVLGGRASEPWFDWKYRSNPYVDHVPILLAETGGEVVGARAFLPLALRVEGTDRLAFQPCDTVVAPDHRRRGLFTRMTEAALDRYADRVDCYFNFPNRYSLPGNRKLGWEVVAERTTYYRVQNPAAWVSDAVAVEPPDRLGEAAADAGRRAARSYFAARERLASASPASAASSEEAAGTEGTAVRWHDRVPPELLASLADAGEPRRFHVARDERFYRWRFDNPTWAYETVVASADGPAAALVVGARTRSDGTRVVQLADVVPLAGSPERDRALSALLPAVLDEHADADVILAEGDSLPDSLLAAHGFRGDRRPPLSWVATPTVQVARPADDGGDWTLEGRALGDPTDWRLALCARDSQ
ncbi:GNAT family N-acetyltransferase [Halorussus rarus]|uniref:GNAT family N-acetyltransferase n=1 Tax=Halorussus TaxID=1070314 RepID=UPI000E20E2D3|nr:GNAT family N-acetyltransferase [Halorussus rarus]NHN60989.1 GNAT family N-acetyltransferase [Halorussus sp. JP-T4]